MNNNWEKSLRRYRSKSVTEEKKLAMREREWKQPSGVNQYSTPSEVRERMRVQKMEQSITGDSTMTIKSSRTPLIREEKTGNPSLGTITNPYKLVDVKRKKDPLGPYDSQHKDEHFHPEYVKLMDESVKKAIPAIGKITSDRVQKGAHYELSKDKQKQAPLDNLMETLTRQYGTSSDFAGGPKTLDSKIFSRMEKGKDHIFGIQEEKGLFGESTMKVKVLPRDELIKKDGQYFEARHTHREFGDKKSPERRLMGAGTMKDGEFNFRTGHYVVEESDVGKLKSLRKTVQEQVQFAKNKTLPEKRQHYKDHALKYPKNAKNTVKVSGEY